MNYLVGPKGQIVIAKDIRDQLGIQPGWMAVQQVVDDHIEVYFVPPEHNRSLKGALSSYSTVRIPDSEAFRQAREDAWMQAVTDDEMASAPTSIAPGP